MRRASLVCLIALAIGVSTGTVAGAQQSTTTTAPPNTTTTSPAVSPSTTAPPATTPPPQRTTTTTRTNAGTTTTTTTRRPVPPPPAGPTQTLVPDLLGTTVPSVTSSTLVPFAPRVPSTVPAETQTASPIAAQKTSPSGATLILATIAWLASLGGLLVYVEDQRSRRWKHLAR